MAQIVFGIDHILKSKLNRQNRWGLVTNDAVLTKDLIHVRKALLEAGYNITLLFSPEHGLDVIGADGAEMAHKTDKLTGLPVFSLYGDNLRPPPSVLQGLDGILFDLPDIGVRFYTYIWTLSHIMEACNTAGLPLVVLDRPNPISGSLDLAEGPILDEKACSSFIGRWNIPVRHSLTIGELALLWQKERSLNAFNLDIIPIKSWQRQQFYQDLNRPFIPTSPAISSMETLLSYPALCFMEGLNVSEGRGTAFPFRICGAPWIDGLKLSNAFNDLKLKGIKARPFSFTPLEGEYKNQICNGIMLHVFDRYNFKPVSIGLHLIYLLKTLYFNVLEWANYPTHVNKTGERHFDLLTGTPSVRTALEHNMDTFFHHINDFTSIENWEKRVKNCLLY